MIITLSLLAVTFSDILNIINNDYEWPSAEISKLNHTIWLHLRAGTLQILNQ